MSRQSATLSGKALSTTARASAKVAHNLVTPKHVEWSELVGLWRLDQWMIEEDRSIQSTIELTPRKTVIICSGEQTRRKTTVQASFTPSHWPMSARIEFTNPINKFHYICTVERKLLAKSVLKLRGKIYSKRWGRKVLVGEFVGRRRLKLVLDGEDDNGEDEGDSQEDYVERTSGFCQNDEEKDYVDLDVDGHDSQQNR